MLKDTKGVVYSDHSPSTSLRLHALRGSNFDLTASPTLVLGSSIWLAQITRHRTSHEQSRSPSLYGLGVRPTTIVLIRGLTLFS